MNNTSNAIKKYVRTKNIINGKFVEFDFAINDPTLFIELILPIAAFKTFCTENNTIEMTAQQGDDIDQEMKKWRYGEETLISSNKQSLSSSMIKK